MTLLRAELRRSADADALVVQRSAAPRDALVVGRALRGARGVAARSGNAHLANSVVGAAIGARGARRSRGGARARAESSRRARAGVRSGYRRAASGVALGASIARRGADGRLRRIGEVRSADPRAARVRGARAVRIDWEACRVGFGARIGDDHIRSCCGPLHIGTIQIVRVRWDRCLDRRGRFRNLTACIRLRGRSGVGLRCVRLLGGVGWRLGPSLRPRTSSDQKNAHRPHDDSPHRPRLTPFARRGKETNR